MEKQQVKYIDIQIGRKRAGPCILSILGILHHTGPRTAQRSWCVWVRGRARAWMSDAARCWGVATGVAQLFIPTVLSPKQLDFQLRSSWLIGTKQRYPGIRLFLRIWRILNLLTFTIGHVLDVTATKQNTILLLIFPPGISFWTPISSYYTLPFN